MIRLKKKIKLTLHDTRALSVDPQEYVNITARDMNKRVQENHIYNELQDTKLESCDSCCDPSLRGNYNSVGGKRW